MSVAADDGGGASPPAAPEDLAVLADNSPLWRALQAGEIEAATRLLRERGEEALVLYAAAEEEEEEQQRRQQQQQRCKRSGGGAKDGRSMDTPCTVGACDPQLAILMFESTTIICPAYRASVSAPIAAPRSTHVPAIT